MNSEQKLAFENFMRASAEYDIENRVCWIHGSVNFCRRGMREGGCVWRTDANSIRVVMDYHAGNRPHWTAWMPGDPCGNCQSRNTAWSTDPTEGAICRDCGAADSDE